MSKQPLIKTVSLSKSYQDGEHEITVLNEVNFEIDDCSMNAIIGSSGSGKSTLLHLLGGLDKATSGHIEFRGQSIEKMSEKQLAQFRNHDIGFIYQFHHLLSDFNVLENIAMPLLISGMKPKPATEIAMNMLEHVKMSHRAKHRSSELSGGERQRVAIARALVNTPKLVLADEPTGNLDQTNAHSILNLLFELNQQLGTAFIMVTHDLQLAQTLPNRFSMGSGKLVAL